MAVSVSQVVLFGNDIFIVMIPDMVVTIAIRKVNEKMVKVKIVFIVNEVKKLLLLKLVNAGKSSEKINKTRIYDTTYK